MQFYLISLLTVLFAGLVLSRIPNEETNDNYQRTTEKGGIHTGQGFDESFQSKNKSNIVTPPNNDTLSNDILPEWGGTCTKRDWAKCSKLKTRVVSHYVDVKKPELGFKHQETDCTLEAVFCLRNGWTVTRCQLLCMQCNKDILKKYDKYVLKEGACEAL